MPSPIEQNRRHIHLLERVFDDGIVRAPKRLGLVALKPRFRGLVLVSANARIGRPRRRIDGIDDVIKADQLKTRLFDEFDRAPEWTLATVIGKEGLAAFARELTALHRPILFDWAAKFGLRPVPQVKPAPPARQPASIGLERSGKPWFVKFDGPCSRCGRTLVKGTEAVWSSRQHRMFCIDCARSLTG
jgi:hypothetical protein